MNVLESAEGGIHYSKLTKEQKMAVDKFYGRKLVKGELNYFYHFTKDGECDWAS